MEIEKFRGKNSEFQVQPARKSRKCGYNFPSWASLFLDSIKFLCNLVFLLWSTQFHFISCKMDFRIELSNLEKGPNLFDHCDRTIFQIRKFEGYEYFDTSWILTFVDGEFSTRDLIYYWSPCLYSDLVWWVFLNLLNLDEMKYFQRYKCNQL